MEPTEIQREIFKNCGEVPLSDSPSVALSRILLVGGISKDGGFSGLDQPYLRWTFLMLEETGIPLHSAFALASINLERGGRDFLAEQPPCDLLVSCFIFNPPDKSAAGVFMNTSSGATCISPHHFKDGVWADSAEKSRAKVVCAVGEYPYEVSGHEFNRPPYIPVRRDNHAFLLLHTDYARSLLESESGTPAFRADVEKKLRQLPHPVGAL